MQIDRPLQRHGGRLEHNEKYCGSCYGAEVVHLFVWHFLGDLLDCVLLIFIHVSVIFMLCMDSQAH